MGDSMTMVKASSPQVQRNRSSAPMATVLPPEEEDPTTVRAAMPREKFRPVKGADYTESFNSQLRKELLEVGKASFKKLPVWATLIESPTRQRLVFRNEFINRRNTIQMNTPRHRRFMQIYRVGEAQRVPCDSCQQRLGPFARCVVDGDGNTFKGACTHCVFREFGHVCEYHERNRKNEANPGLNSGSDPKTKFTSAVTKPPRRITNTKRQPDDHQDEKDNSSANFGTDTAVKPPRKKIKRLKVSKPPANSEAPCIKSDVVFQTTSFTVGDASAEQVQYILKRCDADQRAFLTGAWLSWCSERADLGRPQPYEGIEAFLAAGWYETLNEMIPKVCPIDPG